jgi:hypothetical protein
MVTKKKSLRPDATPAGQKNANTDTWLTRVEAADMLALSIQTLANYETRGELHPQYVYRKTSRGHARITRVYDPQELKKLSRFNRDVIAPRDPGALAARAYEFFDEGRPEREIVRELQMTPDAVSALHEKWKDGGGADLVVTSTAKERLEKIVGSFDSVAELVERVTQLKPKSPQENNEPAAS